MQLLAQRSYSEAFLSKAAKYPSKTILEDLTNLHHLFQQEPLIHPILEQPTSKAEKKQIWTQVLNGLHIQGVVRAFVFALIEQGLLKQLPGLVKQILEKFVASNTQAKVTTAKPLSDTELQQIKSFLADHVLKISPDTIDLENQIDPSLLGGGTIQVKNYWIDYSIAHQLKKLETRMKG